MDATATAIRSTEVLCIVTVSRVRAPFADGMDATATAIRRTTVKVASLAIVSPKQ
jgi:hypothetical protein